MSNNKKSKLEEVCEELRMFLLDAKAGDSSGCVFAFIQEEAEEFLENLREELGWISVNSSLPKIYERVVIRGSELGCFVGCIDPEGKWKIDTPLTDPKTDKRICVSEIETPEYWMPLPI